VEVWDREQFRCPRLHPLPRGCALALRAMPVAAAVISNRGMAAGVVLTTQDVPAKRRRAAALDGAHHLKLIEAHAAAVGVTPSGPVVAEDIRDFQSRTMHEGPASGRWSLGG